MTGIYKETFRNKYYFINKPYDDTATALEDTCLCFPKLFDELLRLYPDISEKFLKYQMIFITKDESFATCLSISTKRVPKLFYVCWCKKKQ
jgi:CRP-like cAMP-binding protein